ncbi:hypothetical protein SSP24_34870 [Streptomyces spinoverrucosus]|uniref:Uncharacterized protein n=1 Tax=Streptomyces spinoverrucosus TaxID=284043 RepID=A0A4Y3VFG8_9ACTN|nr:hypothetical protein SSP24_34870 [Streptomyces spinoverrucosus]GHB82405.1 hypothetical protein GCM10010397_61830 [Streptomyces spinoverrucosus]
MNAIATVATTYQGHRPVRPGVQSAEHADRGHRGDEQQSVDDQVPKAQGAPQPVMLVRRGCRRAGFGHQVPPTVAYAVQSPQERHKGAIFDPPNAALRWVP